jgi:hypothetical protein
MAYGGFKLSLNSKLNNFQIFKFIFASPWIIFIATVLFSAKIKAFKWHAFFANLMYKGCLAVPIARVLGGLF